MNACSFLPFCVNNPPPPPAPFITPALECCLSPHFPPLKSPPLPPHPCRSAFEYIYLQPSGVLSFTGLAVQQPFVRGLLDKYRIRAIVVKREEYKSALSALTGGCACVCGWVGGCWCLVVGVRVGG